MATNVTEKDKTLNEIIDWCEQMEAEGLRLASALLIQHDMDAYSVMQGQISAYEKTTDHCRSMLGHSGSMPSELPNQNENTKYLVTDQQLRYAIYSAIRALDLSKQDDNYTIESTAKVTDKVLELLASSKTTESEQTENPKQAAGREIDTSAYPFIQLEADELVRMICNAYQTGVFSGKEQS